MIKYQEPNEKPMDFIYVPLVVTALTAYRPERRACRIARTQALRYA